jgi:FtsP/CotA-like multicopper oxidase with cupredoxin domain
MAHYRKLSTAGVAVAVVLILIFVTGIVSLPPPNSSVNNLPVVSVTRSTCVRPPGYFLIIADLSGFNDSIAHGAPLNPWPVIHVHEGDTVRIVVCNEDLSQAHGFAIQTYFEAGVILAPGDAFRIVFVATVPGTFVMYCNIFCTVHAFMVSRLVVSN